MNKITFEVRQPRPADAETLADMLFEIHQQAIEEMGACSREACAEWAKNLCSEARSPEGKPTHVIVAFVDRRAMGWGQAVEDSARVGGKGWYVCGLEVRPYCRGNGLGATLAQSLAALARLYDRESYVAVRRENASALKMFQNAGFAEAAGVGQFAPTVAVMVRKKTF
jgi:L-amino acid N-acyltransferase YncA